MSRVVGIRRVYRVSSLGRFCVVVPGLRHSVVGPALRAQPCSFPAHQAPQRHPFVARPALRPTPGTKDAHQAPQKHPLRCEARSTSHSGHQRRTPGPTKTPPSLRGPLYVPLRAPKTHTRPHKNTPFVARPALRPTPGTKDARQAPQKHPLRCEARSTSHSGHQRRTPGPTLWERPKTTTPGLATRATPTHRAPYVRRWPIHLSSGHRRT
ncbi:hypothetical protein ABIA52_003005 [Paenarthrobacter histidinolovorans]|uniref:Uncharacterized protein n=1 Tax=Paenarthrobacter histidinolovorans TaxID=43664 RepID=A0ABW8N949_9MICC